MTEPSHFDQERQSVNTQTNIGHADQVTIHSASTLPVPRQIPPPPLDFTGRKNEIEGILEEFGHGATIYGLQGMGGIGKTAMAYVLADLLRDRFPDGQLFLNMQGTSKSPLTTSDAMANVIRAYLGADAPLPKDLNGLSGLYQSILSGKKALILLDNAANRQQVVPLLPPKNCALLVTSRKRLALPGLIERNLDVLSLDEAKRLLLEIAERIGENAEGLAKLCGCLPIALRNAAYALRESPNMSPEAYTKKLADASKRLELVEASFTTSYELLTPDLQRLWSILSVFPADFDLAGAIAVWEMEETLAEDALVELVKLSLLDFSPSANGEGWRYRLHDLARDFAKSWLDFIFFDLAEQRHSEHYNRVLSTINRIFIQGKENYLAGIQLFDQERANIIAGQLWAKVNMETNSSAIVLCNSYPAIGANILDLLLDPKEQISWLIDGIKAARQLKDNMSEGLHLGNLGNAISYVGRPFMAIKYYEQALIIAREIGDRRGEGNRLGNLGNVYAELGEMNTAIEHYRKALDIDREFVDKKGEAADLGNLGNAYLNLNRFVEAIEYYEKALKIAQEIGDRKWEGATLGNLGKAYTKLHETQKGIEYCEHALRIAREIGDRRGKEASLRNLGNAYLNTDRSVKAIEYYEQALIIAREIGDQRGQEANLGNLGNACRKLDEIQKAIEYYEQALIIAREIGDQRGEEANLGNLAVAYEELGDKRNARRYYNQALMLKNGFGLNDISIHPYYSP